MANGFDWKRFQFLMEVQTALINNAINLSLEDDAKEMRHKFSASGTLINMDDAFYASERIPSDLNAHEAACEFIEFACHTSTEEARRSTWFTRY